MRSLEWTAICGFVLLTLLPIPGCAGPKFLSPTINSLAEWISPPTPPPYATEQLSTAEKVRTCIATAETFARDGHLIEAIGLYEKARRLDPRVEIDCHLLGTFYAQQGDFPNAVREYQVAIKRKPRDVELLNDLGFAYSRQGDLGNSERYYRWALEVKPDHAKARTNLAILLAQQNRLEESLEHFTQAVGPAAAHSNLGAILLQQGRRPEAEVHLHEALRLNGSLAQPRQLLAETRTPPIM